MEMGSRFLNELLPWGDASKGMWAGKRDAMVVKYMEKTGEDGGRGEKKGNGFLCACEGEEGGCSQLQGVLHAQTSKEIGILSFSIPSFVFTPLHTQRTYTGIDKEQAEREVDEYLADKDAYIAKARAEEDKQAKKK